MHNNYPARQVFNFANDQLYCRWMNEALETNKYLPKDCAIFANAWTDRGLLIATAVYGHLRLMAAAGGRSTQARSAEGTGCTILVVDEIRLHSDNRLLMTNK